MTNGEEPKRYWLGGPVEEAGKEQWLVIDGHALPGMRGPDVNAFMGTKAECEQRIEEWNKL